MLACARILQVYPPAHKECGSMFVGIAGKREASRKTRIHGKITNRYRTLNLLGHKCADTKNSIQVASWHETVLVAARTTPDHTCTTVTVSWLAPAAGASSDILKPAQAAGMPQVGTCAQLAGATSVAMRSAYYASCWLLVAASPVSQASEAGALSGAATCAAWCSSSRLSPATQSGQVQ